MSQLPPSPQSPYPPRQPGQPGAPGGAYTMAPQRQTSSAAVASLICGILGCVPLITGLLAVILGIVGMRTTKDPRYSGRGMAIAGLILGLLSLVVWGVIAGGGAMGGWMAYSYTKAEREAAKQFAADVAAGNIEAAQARCTSQVKRDELVQAANKMKGWGTFKDTTLPIGSKQSTNGKEEAYVAGAATFSTAGGVPYIVGFATENGTPKITGFLFSSNDGAVGGGMEPKQSHRSTSSD